MKNGWAKTKDLKKDPSEDDIKMKDLEREAQVAGKGLWNPHGPQVRYWLLLHLFPGIDHSKPGTDGPSYYAG